MQPITEIILLVSTILVFWILTGWFCICYQRKTEILWNELNSISHGPKLNPNQYRYVYNWGDELNICTFAPIALIPILLERVKYNKAEKRYLKKLAQSTTNKKRELKRN